MAGPISRAPLAIEELMAMALLRSLRSSTICTRKDWRAGMSKALISALQHGESDDFPESDDMRQRERGHGERLDGGGGLGPYQQLAAIEALDPDAGKWSQQQTKQSVRRS